jgi:Ala-tRNA(Pro) deacylase
MAELYIDPNFYTTRPDTDGRLDKEIKVYDLLEKLEIPFIRLDHEITATIDSCLAVEEMLQIEICKNLFLCNSTKSQFYLFMLPGNKKLKTSDLSKQIGSSRLSFAPAEYMEEFLNLTPGSVSILGLMNDNQSKVKLLIDRDVLNQEYVGCHPCVNTSSLKLKVSDLLDKFLPYIKHDVTIVDL